MQLALRPGHQAAWLLAISRIKAARVAIADPSVIAKLESGELNFATIDILSNFAKEPVLKELEAEFCGRSKDVAEKIVAPLCPMAKSSVRDRVVPVVVRKGEAAPLFENAEQNSNYLRLNAQCGLRECEEFGERPEERFHFSFVASKEVKQLMFSGDPMALENVIATCP